MKKRTAPSRSKPHKTRAKPVKLPLPFDTAVEGLLAVKPIQKKKPASKKLPKRPKGKK